MGYSIDLDGNTDITHDRWDGGEERLAQKYLAEPEDLTVECTDLGDGSCPWWPICAADSPPAADDFIFN